MEEEEPLPMPALTTALWNGCTVSLGGSPFRLPQPFPVPAQESFQTNEIFTVMDSTSHEITIIHRQEESE